MIKIEMTKKIERLIDLLKNNEQETPLFSIWKENDKLSLNNEENTHYYEKLDRLISPDLIIFEPISKYWILDFIYPVKKMFWEQPKIELEKIRNTIQDFKDVEKIVNINYETSFLSRFSKTLRNIKKKTDTPLFISIPSPLLVYQLISTIELDYLLRTSPSTVSNLVKPIKQLFYDFTIELVEDIVDGVFYHTPYISQDFIHKETYLQKGWRIDVVFLSKLVSKTTFFIKHISTKPQQQAEIKSFEKTLPEGILNWDFEDSRTPLLIEGKKVVSTPVIGGIKTRNIEKEKIYDINEEIKKFLTHYENSILGTGKEISHHIPLNSLIRILKQTIF